MTREQARLYSPLALAYIGDSVYEILVRDRLVRNKSLPAAVMHHSATNFVSARAQSEAARAVWPLLSGEEADIFKRGRNAKPHTTAKNMSLTDYKKATGLEALFGYLYLTGDSDRMEELFEAAYASRLHEQPDGPQEGGEAAQP